MLKGFFQIIKLQHILIINMLIRLITFTLLLSMALGCPSNCQKCTADPNKCEKCVPGYDMSQTTGLCEFSYTDQLNWPGTCASGKKQSPINIDSSSITLCPNGASFYQTTKTILTSIKPEGENLKASYADQSTVTFQSNGTKSTFNSLQFHWHSPSEHRVDGKQFDLELHIVHSNADGSGNLAVTGLFFQVDKDMKNDILDQYNFFADNSTHEFMFPLFLQNKLVFHYQGSLTTPPCTENVNWFVYSEHFPITQRNYDLIKSQINENRSNSRDTQEMNGRSLEVMGGFCNPYIVV